ncbi:MAG TPA: DUF4276 family protein [Chitinophaga sp.]|uniref:DUF4276 family protein n=1 Tax=Chitinophaga sp. TaxID=1869181 RepID=UPI002CE7A82D|nr:DUF4276 family protein [Chitinophaga sp.]HVI47226.1 DUF4276 family protein [Chitinophaga sp.]
MKRIIIICEGPTEVEFCKDILYKYLLSKNILIQTPLVKKSGGGIVPWSSFKRQVENHLQQDGNAIVTTLIDYYGIQDKFNFPRWQESKTIADKPQRMDFLESAMKLAINEDICYRFLPYIQLHEFEGLLFNNINVFTNNIPADDLINIVELEQILDQHPNPELINDTPNNAPSYRLQRLIKGYNKIVYGAILAEGIGLSGIRQKCPRFNNWLTLLESL